MATYPSEWPNQTTSRPPAVPLDPEVARILRRLLFNLASEQEDAAAREAAQVPYWKPCPHSVIGIRTAARVLREAAEALPNALPRLAH